MSLSAGLPVLVNPRAGGGFADGERLAELFRKAGAEPRIHLLSSHQQLLEAAGALAAEHPQLIVAGGGDGTMNALASVLAGTDTALGILPLGTLNHFARDVGIPLAIEAAVQTVIQGKRKAVDVGEVNGRVFVNNSASACIPRSCTCAKSSNGASAATSGTPCSGRCTRCCAATRSWSSRSSSTAPPTSGARRSSSSATTSTRWRASPSACADASTPAG